MPDILLGISLLLLFVTVLSVCGEWVRRVFGIEMELGMTTIIIAHITFCMSYVTMVVLGRLQEFDSSLVEAAQDLGATRLQAFFRVFIPGISRGIWTAIIVVLIPALGAYLIPDLVGGTASELIGDKIAQRTFIDRNLPHASALSALLMFVVMIPIFFVVFFTGSRKSITGTRHSRGVKQK